MTPKRLKELRAVDEVESELGIARGALAIASARIAELEKAGDAMADLLHTPNTIDDWLKTRDAWRKLRGEAKRSPEEPEACPFCGRVMLAGYCCKTAAYRAGALR